MKGIEHGLLAAITAFLPAALPAEEARDRFHEAYYLEVEEGDLEGAIAIYEQVIEDGTAAPELLERARERLAGAREALRARDLSRLMPPEALAYFEVRNPGRHLGRILRAAGLTNRDAGTRGGPSSSGFTVSPSLVEGLERLEGAAAAITHIEPRRGIPHGVVILHPGRAVLLRGIIETALSAGVLSEVFQRAEPTAGYATFTGPFGTVILTERLVIAGMPHSLAVEAAERLRSGEGATLGERLQLAPLGESRSRAVLFTYADAPRILQLARESMTRRGRLSHEYRMLQAIADIESVEWAACALGTSGREVSADFWLRLEEGNHSLPLHLLRTPPVDPETLSTAPAEIAALVAFSLGDDAGGEVASRARTAEAITGLDLGREVFSNIDDVVLFAGGRTADAMPPLAAVITVRRPERSRELWQELLRIPAALLGLPPEPRLEAIDGVKVEVRDFPENIRVFLATLKDRVVIANDRELLGSALAAGRGNGDREKGSVLEDEGFAAALSSVDGDTSKVLILQLERLVRLFGRHAGMSRRDRDVAARLLEGGLLTLVTKEGPTGVHVNLTLALPHLGRMIERMIHAERTAAVRGEARAGRSRRAADAPSAEH